ncbi:hypothetical protein [Acidiphilium multivorum]|uniref:hypothetical protein n=1 Tax=Acidiphilium multivorum TaxID=62140 RepID=UPI001F4C2D5D|nr:hypothetical protein [Acidiphilium multivorum]
MQKSIQTDDIPNIRLQFDTSIATLRKLDDLRCRLGLSTYAEVIAAALKHEYDALEARRRLASAPTPPPPSSFSKRVAPEPVVPAAPRPQVQARPAPQRVLALGGRER